MNNQWNRKRFSAWVGGNSNNPNKFANMSHFSNNWNSKSWHSSPFKRQRRNDYHYRPQRHQPRRQSSTNLFSNRWEPLPNDIEFNFPRENIKRNDFKGNSNGDSGNYRKRLDFHFDNDTNTLREDQQKDTRPYLKWCNDILQEDPNQRYLRMQKLFWDRLDPKDDIRYLAKTSKRNAVIPVYDGVTPIGKEGISKAWLCSICNIVLLDVENKKLHLMQKKHYVRYANFCKKYADEKLLKLELEKKAKKEKKERKSSKKKKLNNSSSSKYSEANMEVRYSNEEYKKTSKSAKENKESIKDKHQFQIQEKSNKQSPKIDSFAETISIEESLNYDFLE